MTALSIVLDIVLILISLVLIAAVLMQQGQRQGLGAISGGAETFFGKNKARGLDAKLAKITKICAVAFIVLAIATTMVAAHNKANAPASIDDAISDLSEAMQGETAQPTEAADGAEAPAEGGETEAPAEGDEAEPTDAAQAEPTEAADAQ